MHKFLTASAVAAFALAAAPAHAVIVNSVTASGASTGTVITAAPNLFEADLELGGLGETIVFNLTAENGEEAGVSFNAFAEFLTAFGVNELFVTLTNATFRSIGSVEGAFSFPTVSNTATLATIRFPGREFVSLALGAVGGGGTNWVIGGLTEGQDFSIAFAAFADVPAPAAVALFGLGVFGLAALRRR